ncbi:MULTISPECIES: iminosuccinate reductase BhcD [unclassified Mesorhizobium]|uniref:iminosuccinate reductase BhcD n=1 Tax=unclassified Mesorhizobium TaxID=325217 RepID=UPI000FCC10EB|nr:MULTISPECIES: iminosuccinate reductase BhcD [unclassified Mesorhizobium]TGP18192.1 ornithine cyclodeaminase family protein [Mesorhizobium sp. M1D.F.Ca.ET.231.01.1.1]TGP25430.1 ornithine cyclodeaminase family protein [Mesorhizobium sp. M1D.F.Ca.ET.234.01.1.1]TGS38316.1 ornithine cyclodeaminase family protein [Mesorhizobium sp. M1D.F.Ca.ET.184.01.1.1]TGS58323.1 ornithine cyclodeaminase family protein [Mesorhizobium sp. M1D.F.Ca.ET.183.01.1.1]
MIIIPEHAIAELVSPADCLTAVEGVFASMSNRSAYNFPVVREAIGHADALYGFKSGFDRDRLVLGLKSGGFWPGNIQRGLANHQSTIFLFDADTGRCRAVVGGNLLTAMRTAAASAISIKYLARPKAKIIGMIGAGHQSTFQLKAALDQRPFEKVVAWNIDPSMLVRLEAVAKERGLPFESVDLDQLGREADVIITITSSFKPILMASQVRPGTHIACMGTDTKGKQEVEAELMAEATVFADEITQSATIGEAQHAVGQGLICRGDIVEIGAVIRGDHFGRTDAEEITLFDGTGVGLQDLAVASAAVERAILKGIALDVDF